MMNSPKSSVSHCYQLQSKGIARIFQAGGVTVWQAEGTHQIAMSISMPCYAYKGGGPHRKPWNTPSPSYVHEFPSGLLWPWQFLQSYTVDHTVSPLHTLNFTKTVQSCRNTDIRKTKNWTYIHINEVIKGINVLLDKSFHLQIQN